MNPHRAWALISTLRTAHSRPTPPRTPPCPTPPLQAQQRKQVAAARAALQAEQESRAAQTAHPPRLELPFEIIRRTRMCQVHAVPRCAALCYPAQVHVYMPAAHASTCTRTRLEEREARIAL